MLHKLNPSAYVGCCWCNKQESGKNETRMGYYQKHVVMILLILYFLIAQLCKFPKCCACLPLTAVCSVSISFYLDSAGISGRLIPNPLCLFRNRITPYPKEKHLVSNCLLCTLLLMHLSSVCTTHPCLGFDHLVGSNSTLVGQITTGNAALITVSQMACFKCPSPRVRMAQPLPQQGWVVQTDDRHKRTAKSAMEWTSSLFLLHYGLKKDL